MEILVFLLTQFRNQWLIFKGDIMLPPKVWAEKIYNVVQWNEYDGGHFAAMERPKELSSDVIQFINKLEL